MTFRRTLAIAAALGAVLVAQVAAAQRVVVLQFDGDKKDRIRTQIVRELTDANELELVPLKDFGKTAAREGIRPNKIMGPTGVAAAAKKLKIAVALEGAVSDTFFVRILDASGNELWSKELPVKKGEISPKNAGRLAKAFTAAAQAQAGAAPVEEKQPPKEEASTAEESSESSESSEATAKTEKTAKTEEKTAAKEEKQEEGTMPGLDLTGPKETPEERERRMREEDRESHTATGREALRGGGEGEGGDEDLESEAARRRKKAGHVGPKLIKITLAGTTTWRAYCSRPGVKSCVEYDTIAEGERPAGDTVDFSPQVPYAGFGLQLEFFPMASFDNPANGIGLSASFSRGFSLTNVRIQTPGGDQPEQKVISIDDSWHVFGHYRFHFGYGPERDPLVGYVGIRGGIAARTFEVDQTARVPLPGSHRRFPAAGIEASVPIMKFFKIEAGGLYFFNPIAGPDELVAYGTDDSATGWMAEGGLAGDIWGPIGYSLKFRLMSFKDQFSGQGNKWSNGGAAEETYTGLFWGVTAAF